MLTALPEEGGAAEGLTSIHPPIHWPDTFHACETTNELEQIHIDNFLNTLAEVALAVAKRKEYLGG